MKAISAGFFAVIVCTSLGACRKPKDVDLVGTWVGRDGGELILRADGTFSARELPAKVFIMPDSIDSPLRGSGRWKLEPHNLFWSGDTGKLELDFDELTGLPLRFGTSAIVTGSGKSIGLFQWKGEEGGERYEFQRK